MLEGPLLEKDKGCNTVTWICSVTDITSFREPAQIKGMSFW